MEIQKKQGKFFAFEGIDGSGKSTQLQILSERLKEQGMPCYTSMEPTDSLIGSMIHNIMTGRLKADNRVLASLFVADRLDHLLNEVNGIVDKIESGITVLMDRYIFSSYAYQSIDLPMDWVIQANEACTKILRPTATIFIDTDPETAMERIQENRYERELFEEIYRLKHVRNQYMEAFEKQEGVETVIRINGNQSIEEVSQEIWEKIQQFMHETC